MITPINDALYEIICGWWKAYGWPILPKELLPKRGYVAFIDEKPIIAGFILKDMDIPFGVFAYPTANPEASYEERTIGFSKLLAHVYEVSREIGLRHLMVAANNKSLCQRYLDNGFLKCDENVIHFYKEIICPQP